MRYPPDGRRGLALSTRGAGLGELGHADVQAINRRILGIIQVESPSAVEHAAEIAAIDGVDVLFVGPTDLSHSLGLPGRFDDPAYLGALERVVAAAEGAGARRPGSCSTTLVRCRVTASSGSGSSASGRTARSSPTGLARSWRQREPSSTHSGPALQVHAWVSGPPSAPRHRAASPVPAPRVGGVLSAPR